MQYLQQIGRAHDARGGGVAPRLQPCHEPPHDRWDERGRRHVEVQWENLRCLGPPLVVAQRGVEVHVVVRRLEPCEQRRVFSDISVVLRQPCQIAQARHGEDVRPTRNLRPVNRLECQPVAVVPPRHQAEKRIHVARHEVHERFCCGVMLHRKGNVTSFDGHFPRHHGTHHHPRWVPGPASNVRERNHIREGTGCFIEAAAGQASVVAPKAIVGRIATHIHIGLGKRGGRVGRGAVDGLVVAHGGEPVAVERRCVEIEHRATRSELTVARPPPLLPRGAVRGMSVHVAELRIDVGALDAVEHLQRAGVEMHRSRGGQDRVHEQRRQRIRRRLPRPRPALHLHVAEPYVPTRQCLSILCGFLSLLKNTVTNHVGYQTKKHGNMNLIGARRAVEFPLAMKHCK
eukprot:m.1179976 g.1179976  ORF g.1179976 m.1179976 type:complete len:401 (-) comp24529_c0_seq79:2286-3488(-)